MRVKLVGLGVSALFALGISLAGLSDAQAGQAPGAAGEIAGKPQGIQGESQKPKPKTKPKTKSIKGKGKPGDQGAVDPKPEPQGKPDQPKLNPDPAH